MRRPLPGPLAPLRWLPHVFGWLGVEATAILSPILVRLAVSSSDGRSHPTTARVIRSGQLMKTVTEPVPFAVTLRDTAPEAGEMSYYRLMICTSDEHRIVSNPIFVRGE